MRILFLLSVTLLFTACQNSQRNKNEKASAVEQNPWKVALAEDEKYLLACRFINKSEGSDFYYLVGPGSKEPTVTQADKTNTTKSDDKMKSTSTTYPISNIKIFKFPTKDKEANSSKESNNSELVSLSLSYEQNTKGDKITQIAGAITVDTMTDIATYNSDAEYKKVLEAFKQNTEAFNILVSESNEFKVSNPGLLPGIKKNDVLDCKTSTTASKK